MSAWEGVGAGVSPYLTAGIGLVGSLIGGAIAAFVSLTVARQARRAAETTWIRDNRREIFDRFLTTAQTLLIQCEERKRSPRPGQASDAVQEAFVEFFNAYGVVQTVSERPVVDAVRVYAYRLLELKESLGSTGVLGPERFHQVAPLIRQARHDTIDAMREELGLAGSARPPEGYNPFAGTDLAEEYRERRYGKVELPESERSTSVGLPL